MFTDVARRQPAPAASDDPQWEFVRRKKGLSAADKLAWWYLWRRSRGGVEQVLTSSSEIAADQGTSGETGGTRIRNLRSVGLLEIIRHDRATGEYLLQLAEPLEASKGHAVAWDGQRTLFDVGEPDDQPAADWDRATDSTGRDSSEAGLSEPAGVFRIPCRSQNYPAIEVPHEEAPEEPIEEPPEVPPEDPRSPLHRNHRNHRARAPYGSSSSEPSTTTDSDEPMSPRMGRLGTSGGSSVGTSEERQIAFLARTIEARRAETSRAPAAERAVGQAVRQQLPAPLENHEAQRDAAERLAQEVTQRLADPGLRLSPVLRVTWAIVEGRIPRTWLYQTLNAVDAGRKRSADPITSPGKYFVCCAKQACARYGVEWPSPRKPR